MSSYFPDGIWPTMVTPFDDSGEIDYPALDSMVDWYIENGSNGLFATCQSSESFFLSLKERAEVTAYIKKSVGSRIPVIASGHVSYGLEDQVKELNVIAEAGADAVILISNRLARANESDDVMLDRLDRLVARLPKEIPLGFYECPYPYKRILTQKVIRYCVESGRFYFLKDTSCDIENIREKIGILQGSRMKLYNANTATLLESLRAGAAGYSGVMGNYHPWLYRWLFDHRNTEPEKAELLQSILTMCSFIELKNYPSSAKECLHLYGVPITCQTRKNPAPSLSQTERLEVCQLKLISDYMRRVLEG